MQGLICCLDNAVFGVSVQFPLPWKYNQYLNIFYMLSDGYAYYEEWQNLVEKSDKQVKELLECFGTKCKRLKEPEKVFESGFL